MRVGIGDLKAFVVAASVAVVGIGADEGCGRERRWRGGIVGKLDGLAGEFVLEVGSDGIGVFGAWGAIVDNDVLDGAGVEFLYRFDAIDGCPVIAVLENYNRDAHS